jgi:tetratricopeptide (TPR) repeat protein
VVESGSSDRYSFSHALIQNSLYKELSPARRQRAHRRVGEALEVGPFPEDATTLAELAHHWIAAIRPADIDKALSYVCRAGHAALEALAPDDAIRWYQTALDLVANQIPPDERQRVRLLVDLGNAQRLASHPEHRDTFVQAGVLAERIGDTRSLVDAAFGFAQLHWSQTFDDPEAKQIIEAALRAIDAEASAVRARLLSVLASVQTLSRRPTLCLEAVGLAKRSGDGGTFVEVIDTTLFNIASPERRDDAIADVEHAVAVADQTGDPARRITIRTHLLWARYQQTDLRAVDTVIAEVTALAEIVGLSYHRWLCEQIQTGRLLLRGKLAQAEAGNERALEQATKANAPAALTIFGGILVQIRRYQGRIDEIGGFIIDAARDNPSVEVLRAAVPILLCELGRIEEARERIAEEAANGFEFTLNGSWLSAISYLVDAAVTAGEHAAAHTLIERLAPFSDHVISPLAVIVEGAVARPLARAATLLGNYDQAERWFAIAHDIHSQLQAPYWTTLGELDHADLCLVRRANGDVKRARDLAERASATAHEYGFGTLSKRASALLTS